MWSGLSLLVFVGGLFATVAVVGFLEGTLGLDHGLGLALWPLVWGAIALPGVVLAANLVFTIGPTVRRRTLLLPLIGIALAAVTEVLLYEWSVDRYGWFDPEYIRATAGLFAVLVGLATATFAVLIAPPRAAAWPAGVALICAAGVLVVFLANVPGLADGIAATSLPLAAAMGAVGAYALVCGAVAARSLPFIRTLTV